jgi:hypothetical protein
LSAGPSRRLSQPGQTVKDEAPGHSHIKAGALAHHRDLDAGVGFLDPGGRDALGLVPEEHYGPLTGWSQPGQRGGALGQFDGDDQPAL